jgi:hypothetical protein
MSTALAKINARVKYLQKKHPNTQRKTLQKQAGREYRAGKLGGVKKKTARKKVVRRVGAVRKKSPRVSSHNDGIDSKTTTIHVGSVHHHLGSAKRALIHDIGMKEARMLTLKKAADKRKLRKQIAEKKSLYRKLK